MKENYRKMTWILEHIIYPLFTFMGIRGEFCHWEKFACVQSMNVIYNAKI